MGEVLAAHDYEYPSSHCDCGHWMSRPWAEYRSHVAEQIAPLLAAARAEELRTLADEIDPGGYGWTGPRDARRFADRIRERAARIARTAPSTDQATTPPGVTGGSGEGS